jgi:hypothetical protein
MRAKLFKDSGIFVKEFSFSDIHPETDFTNFFPRKTFTQFDKPWEKDRGKVIHAVKAKVF